MDAYREVFLSESAEFIQLVTDGLLALETNPKDREPVESVFRGAHSLKGMAAAMGYNRTADLTHRMEGLMARVRSGEQAIDSPLIDVMLAAIDLARDLIDDESSGRSDVDPAEMIALLLAMAEKGSAAALEAEVVEARTPAPDDDTSAISGSETIPGASIYRIDITLDESCVLKAVRAYMVIKRFAHMGRVVETEPAARDIEDERFDRTFSVILETLEPVAEIEKAARGVSEIETVSVTEQARSAAAPPEAALHDDVIGRRRSVPKLSETQTVRVSIAHLDELVNLVGELVILRSRLDRIAHSVKDVELYETLEEMHRITQDLQFEVLQTRMVPVGNIFNRFPRMVRDLAHELGKRVDFRMDGLDIELDRTVLDEIGDPVVHLLRNAIDHGVEVPEKRTAAGKPPIGEVRLEARRERDHVAILVSDDGRGIDVERVWKKAVERGIVRADQRDECSDGDVLLLTCLPGFSTVEKTTKVSGRGVGMDVVKGKIEHLGGTLAIRSTPGKGTEFELRLPLTLAIVRSLLVESCGQTFALPLSAINEVFDAADLNLDTLDGAPVVLLRDGEVVPLVRLDAILFGHDGTEMPEPKSNVVLVDAAGEQKALHVDALLGRQEVVVKPLTKLFRDSRGYAGATILGDGRVVLILDPRTMFMIAEETQ
jgi:two-component system chemotaxis sensor kinase CheA